MDISLREFSVLRTNRRKIRYIYTQNHLPAEPEFFFNYLNKKHAFFSSTDKCLLTDNIYDYYNVSQGKVTIPSMDDGEEFSLTDVSRVCHIINGLYLSFVYLPPVVCVPIVIHYFFILCMCEHIHGPLSSYINP